MPSQVTNEDFFAIFAGTMKFFERLVTSVAVIAGGLAIVKFQEKIIGICPIAAFSVGILLFFVGIGLAILSAADWFSKYTHSINHKAVEYALAAIVMVCTVFFVVGGALAAAASL